MFRVRTRPYHSLSTGDFSEQITDTFRDREYAKCHMTMVADIDVSENSAYRRGIISTINGINKLSTNVLFDSGSNYNLIPITHNIILHTELQPLRRPIYLSGAFAKDNGKSNIQCTHFVELDLDFDLQEGGSTTLHRVKFIVVPERCQFAVILGINTMRNRKILTGYRLGILEGENLRVFALKAQTEIIPQGQNQITGRNIYWISIAKDFKKLV